MTAAEWLAASAPGSPAELVTRAREWLSRIPGSGIASEDLARAGREALGAVIASAGGRPAAADLLAADALITLALEARAAEDPATLGAFAANVRRAGSA
jgi:hypothetical protein